MSPSPPSSTKKLAHSASASSLVSTDGIRKRVYKACDRCRLKKSKCDGMNPCSRCKTENAICVFGERKRSHDKIYPKGYVEMLEQQQTRLISGMRALYRRLLKASAWEGLPLEENDGQPLTHDMLAALNLLEPKHDGNGDLETFDENCEPSQSKLVAGCAGYSYQRESLSSDPEHSHREHPRSTSNHNTSLEAKHSLFEGSANLVTPTSPPLWQRPDLRLTLPPPPYSAHRPVKPTPFLTPASTKDDPQLHPLEWVHAITPEGHQKRTRRDKHGLHQPGFEILPSIPWHQQFLQFDPFTRPSPFQEPLFYARNNGGLSDINDIDQLGAVNTGFSVFVQPQGILT